MTDAWGFDLCHLWESGMNSTICRFWSIFPHPLAPCSAPLATARVLPPPFVVGLLGSNCISSKVWDGPIIPLLLQTSQHRLWIVSTSPTFTAKQRAMFILISFSATSNRKQPSGESRLHKCHRALTSPGLRICSKVRNADACGRGPSKA